MSGKKRDYASSISSHLTGSDHKDGEMPKPIRINVIVRVVRHLHTELMAVENVGEAIAAKDPRTQQAYIETLARLKTALVDLEEMVDILHAALHDRERIIKDGSRSKLLLRLWNSGKSGEEVAAIMGIKPVSVYSWLTKLRAKGKNVRSPMQETDKGVRPSDM